MSSSLHLPFRDLPSFDEIKARVSIEHVLAARGIHLRRRGNRLVGPCPVHQGDNPTAFSVDRARGLWYCFSGCRRGGDVIELVRLLDGVTHREAASRLATMAPLAPMEAVRSPSTRSFRPFERSLFLDANTPWLLAKGIHPITARAYECGAWHGTGMLTGCVAVRLHTPEGAALGYAGRRLVGAGGKWVFPTAFPKNEVLYGHHRVDPTASELVVVECPWGVMRLAQLGVPVVGLLGTSLSDRQAELLSRRQRVTLMMDGDPAGRRAANAAAGRLELTVDVRIVRLPAGKDPDDLADEELVRLVE